MVKEVKKRTNCPNCGAPIKHSYNYSCEYCGTFLHNTDENLKKIDNVDLIFDRLDVYNDMIEYRKILTVYAHTVPKANYYKEGFYDLVVSEDNINQKVAFKIAIPYEKWRECVYNLNSRELISYILDSLPPPFKKIQYEIYNHIIEIIQNEYRREYV